MSRPSPTPVTKEEREAIIKMRNDGATIVEIQAKFHRATTTIYDIFELYGIRVHRYSMAKILPQITKLRKNGKTHAEIASVIGCHKSTVAKWLRYYAKY